MPSRQAPQSPSRPSTRRRPATLARAPPSPTEAVGRSSARTAAGTGQSSKDVALMADKLEALSLVKDGAEAAPTRRSAVAKSATRAGGANARSAGGSKRPVKEDGPSKDADDRVDRLAKGVQQLSLPARKAPLKSTVLKSTASSKASTSAAATAARSNAPSKKSTALAGASASSATPAEQASAAMKTVNATLVGLSQVKASGWKAAKEADAGLEKVKAALEQGVAALVVLRKLVGQGRLAPDGAVLKGKEVDVERAALAMSAKLVEIDMFVEALQLLSKGHSHLAALYFASATPAQTTSRSPSELGHVLSYPLPSSFDAEPQILQAVPLVLVATIQAFTAWLKLPEPTTAPPARPRTLASSTKGKNPATKEGQLLARVKVATQALASSSSLVQWAKALKRAGQPELEKKAAAGMQSLYAMVMKACAMWDETVDSKAILHLRRAALVAFLRLQASPYPDAVSDKADPLLDQARRSLALYARATGASSPEDQARQVDLAVEARAFFNQVVDALAPSPGVSAPSTALRGKGATALCELVIALAHRVDDLETVSCVNSHIAAFSLDNDDIENDVALSPAQKREAFDAQLSRITARLAGTTAALERYLQTGKVEGLEAELKQSPMWVRSLANIEKQARATEAVVDQGTGRKVQSALDRMRRLCLKVLRKEAAGGKGKSKAVDVDPEIEATILASCCSAARAVVDVTIASTNVEANDDILSNMVDTLLCLADSGFDPADPSSRNSNFEDLDRSRDLVERRFASLAAESKPWSDRDVRLVRCVSSGLYNAGVALYNADQVGAALRFLSPACDFPTRILALDRWNEPSGATSAVTEVEELRKQLVRRWELVALAQLQVDKHRAHSAYVSAILAHPLSQLAKAAEACGRMPLVNATTAETALLKLVQRGSRLAVLDLLLPPEECSLARSLEEASPSPEVVGMVLELQIAQLSTHLRKPECRSALGGMLEDLLRIYTADGFPIRRARSLVRLMEHRVISGESPASSSATLDELACEVDELCEISEKGADAGLQHFAQQYRAFSHLWVGLAAQQQGQHDVMVREMQAAIQALRPIAVAAATPKRERPSTQHRVSGAFNQSQFSAKSHSPLATRSAPSKVSATARGMVTPRVGRKKLAMHAAQPAQGPRTAASKSAMITPSPKRTPSQAVSTSPQGLAATMMALDDWERNCQHLSLTTQILRAQGQTSLRISLMRILSRFLNYVTTQGGASSDKAAALAINNAVELASDYLVLGRTYKGGVLLKQAEAKLDRLPERQADISARLSLYKSLHSALTGDVDEAHRIYHDARLAFETDGDDVPQSSTERILHRTRKLHRSALAASTFSFLRATHGDLRGAVAGATQALRLLDRASSNLRRVATPQPLKAPTSPSEATFGDREDRDPKAPLPEVPAEISPRPFSLDPHPTGEMTWQVGAALLEALQLVVTLYLVRGSPRTAEGYLRQTVDLCTQLAAPRIQIRSLVLQADFSALTGEFFTALSKAQAAKGALDLEPCPESVHVGRSLTDILWLQRQLDDAFGSATSAQKTLLKLGSVYSDADELSPTSKKTPRQSLPMKRASPGRDANELVMPAVGARLARLRVRIAHRMASAEDLGSELRRLSKTSLGSLDRALEFSLVASIRLGELRLRLKYDPLLGLLNEAVIALPFSASQSAKIPSCAEHLAVLDESLSMLRSAIGILKGAGEVAAVREAMYTFADLRSLQYILGRTSATAPGEIAAALDFGSSITVERELLESAQFKTLPQAVPDDLAWPTNDSRPSPSANLAKAYWRNVEELHQLAASDPVAYRPLVGLPSSWRVVSLHLAQEQDGLVLVRHTTSAPSVFYLPFDRQGRRESEEELFTFEAADQELKSIIRAANASTQRAKHVTEHQAKALWWAERKELDERMSALVETVENRWLGACKGLLHERVDGVTSANVKARLERVLLRHLMSPQDRQANRIRLDDAAVAAFAALPKDCQDEDLEDLLYFAIDMFQLAGASVVCDEVDTDQVVCDLRDVQKSLEKPIATDDGHLFLVLDKHLQAFPWEMLPILNSRSVSRVPNLAFLRDRLALPPTWSTGGGSVAYGRIIADASKATWILNPSGDLVGTQGQFEQWLEGNEKKGWRGFKGRAPSSEEVRHDLSSSDLLLYFGHGGAEQYIRSQSVRQLQRCAVTMLWGCSSGELRNVGVFDPYGTPNTYLLGGCPTLLANLWDVTDKDIDRLAKDVFRRIGLDSEDVQSPVTLGQALAEARSTCRLKYLNGAAPVIYGMPCSFAWPSKE